MQAFKQFGGHVPKFFIPYSEGYEGFQILTGIPGFNNQIAVVDDLKAQSGQQDRNLTCDMAKAEITIKVEFANAGKLQAEAFSNICHTVRRSGILAAKNRIANNYSGIVHATAISNRILS